MRRGHRSLLTDAARTRVTSQSQSSTLRWDMICNGMVGIQFEPFPPWPWFDMCSTNASVARTLHNSTRFPLSFTPFTFVLLRRRRGGWEEEFHKKCRRRKLCRSLSSFQSLAYPKSSSLKCWGRNALFAMQKLEVELILKNNNCTWSVKRIEQWNSTRLCNSYVHLLPSVPLPMFNSLYWPG